MKEAGLSAAFDLGGVWGNLTVGDNRQPIASYSISLFEVDEIEYGFTSVEAEDSEFWDSWQNVIANYEDFESLLKTNFESDFFSLLGVLSQSLAWHGMLDRKRSENPSGVSVEEIYREVRPNISRIF